MELVFSALNSVRGRRWYREPTVWRKPCGRSSNRPNGPSTSRTSRTILAPLADRREPPPPPPPPPSSVKCLALTSNSSSPRPPPPIATPSKTSIPPPHRLTLTTINPGWFLYPSLSYSYSFIIPRALIFFTFTSFFANFWKTKNQGFDLKTQYFNKFRLTLT